MRFELEWSLVGLRGLEELTGHQQLLGSISSLISEFQLLCQLAQLAAKLFLGMGARVWLSAIVRVSVGFHENY